MNVLIQIFTAIAEGEKGLASFKAISSIFGLNEAKIGNLLKRLSPSQEKSLVARFGEPMINRAKSSITPNQRHTPVIRKHLESSWIEWISWVPKLNVLTLKVKGNPKHYKLPFFPYRVVRAMMVNKSPGKAIWNGYWRVVGKGTVSNKTKNKVRVVAHEVPIKIVNKLIPSHTRRLKGKNKRIVLRGRVKTSNIPKTGAKGIQIKIKRPKLGK